MRTTLDLPDPLLRQLKSRAALEGTTLKQLVRETIERGLGASPGSSEDGARTQHSAQPRDRATTCACGDSATLHFARLADE